MVPCLKDTVTTTNFTDKQIIDLYDVNGKHIFNKNVTGTTEIDANALDNGIYTLTLKNNLDSMDKKLIIVR